MAKKEHQGGDFTTAQRICTSLITHKSRDMNVLLLTASTFFSSQHFDECIGYLEQAKSINPKCSEVLRNFGLVYMRKSQNNLAKQYLFQVCAIKPYCCDAWTDYGDFLFENKDFVTSKDCYFRAMCLKPELHGARNKYGKVLLKLNKIKEAKKEFKIAHKSAKECPETLNNLGDAYYKSGKFGKSILKYKQLLETNPNRTNACFQLGMAYLKLEDYHNAADAFKKVIILDPKNVLFLKKLAVTVDIYQKCLNLKPEDFDLNLELALMYFNNIQNYHEAVIYLKKCSQLNPGRIDIYKKLFETYGETKDHLNASDACMSMGNLYLEKDDYKNARNSFCCAVLMNPRNAFGHWEMGLTLYQLGHEELAFKK
ncbi:RNA polymerase II-associated protein 3-like isoform X2 [Acyrthosiphon pisum]|nr:RNA polymerase II-associated protein 3-like isoform X2 [Acyrthosiphon pisum]|eukprot:XP_016663712.1 PREDICTED: RNA polymerase II-associated protein 3-like isoform X2 [Acyrthosiphon pisum]